MSEPTIWLPAPWGAAAVLGLIRAIPQAHPSTLRGRVVIEQIKGQDVKHGTALLRDAALTRGKDLARHYPWEVFIAQGVLGSVLVLDRVDLRDPACGLQYNDHYNLGERACFRFPWALVVREPQCTYAPTAPPVVASANPAQAGLFGGQA